MVQRSKQASRAVISAKSLAIDLLSTMPARYPVPVGSLIHAAGILGIAENSMRVALVRLRERGLVESDERGLYRLGASAGPVNRHVLSWRSIEEQIGPWDGSWVALEAASSSADRGATRRRQRALHLIGFRPLTRTLHVRPNNLNGGVDAMRQRLDTLGAGHGPVFQLSEFDAETETLARELWNARALEVGYRKTCASLEASAKRMLGLSNEEAMSESFRLGGEAVRQIVLDPLLPTPIIDTKARRALVKAMQRYDRLGRRYWSAWAGESVELERSPAAVGQMASGLSPV